MRGINIGIASAISLLAVAVVSKPMMAETTKTLSKSVSSQTKTSDDFFKVAICVPFAGCRDTPSISVPSLDNLVKGEIYKALANVLAEQEPIASSANKIFPTVDVLPGGAFRPRGVSVFLNKQIRTSVDGTVMLRPGDYTIPVDVFCMKHSASSPSGHKYLLARLKGKMADVITALNSRSVGSGISHQQLQVLSWNIQAGMKYEAMSPDNRAIVDKLLPDYKSRMSQSFLEKVESQYNQFRFPNLPSFNSALDRLGDAGNIVKQYRQFSSNLRQYGGDYNSLSRLLITSGKLNARGGVNNTPWSKISDRIYGRMVTEGNAGTPGELQIRVLPELTNSSIYSKGALVASNNLTNTLPQKQISSQLVAAKPVSKVDITNLVADPQNSNIQPLSMSPIQYCPVNPPSNITPPISSAKNSPYKLIIYVARGKTLPPFGHSWIELSDGKSSKYYGFEPTVLFDNNASTHQKLNLVFQEIIGVSGKLDDSSNLPYDVKKEYTITEQGYNDANKTIRQWNTTYEIGTLHHCTTFAGDVADSSGAIPRNKMSVLARWWFDLFLVTPDDLANYLSLH